MARKKEKSTSESEDDSKESDGSKRKKSKSKEKSKGTKKTKMWKAFSNLFKGGSRDDSKRKKKKAAAKQKITTTTQICDFFKRVKHKKRKGHNSSRSASEQRPEKSGEDADGSDETLLVSSQASFRLEPQKKEQKQHTSKKHQGVSARRKRAAERRGPTVDQTTQDDSSRGRSGQSAVEERRRRRVAPVLRPAIVAPSTIPGAGTCPTPTPVITAVPQGPQNAPVDLRLRPPVSKLPVQELNDENEPIGVQKKLSPPKDGRVGSPKSPTAAGAPRAGQLGPAEIQLAASRLNGPHDARPVIYAVKIVTPDGGFPIPCYYPKDCMHLLMKDLRTALLPGDIPMAEVPPSPRGNATALPAAPAERPSQPPPSPSLHSQHYEFPLRKEWNTRKGIFEYRR